MLRQVSEFMEFKFWWRDTINRHGKFRQCQGRRVKWNQIICWTEEGVATSGRAVKEDLSEKWPEWQGDLGKGALEDSEGGMNWAVEFSKKLEAMQSEHRAGGEGLGGGQWQESFGGQGKECGLHRKVEMTPTGGFPVWSDTCLTWAPEGQLCLSLPC